MWNENHIWIQRGMLSKAGGLRGVVDFQKCLLDCCNLEWLRIRIGVPWSEMSSHMDVK